MSIDISKLTFPDSVVVTDQVIDTSTLAPEQQQAFIDLFRHVVELYQAAGVPRYVLGLAGPTGSGKSVIASLFDHFASQLKLSFRFASVGIDAFHFTNAYLMAHTVDGAVMKTFKGRYDTYDVAKLARALTAFRAGQDLKFPVYSRTAHDPVEDVIDISGRNVLLLLEGLWLLHDAPEWNEIRSLIIIRFSSKRERKRPVPPSSGGTSKAAVRSMMPRAITTAWTPSISTWSCRQEAGRTRSSRPIISPRDRARRRCDRVGGVLHACHMAVASACRGGADDKARWQHAFRTHGTRRAVTPA